MKRSDNMEQILAYIDAHPDKNITVGELAALLDYSFYHFCHAFSSYTGVPVAAYLRRRRMAAAARDLLSGKSSVSVAAARGFQTLSGFAKAFRKHYGLSPSEYQKELADERFRIEPEFRSLASFTAVGYRLSPPQGESDVLNAGAYWMGREFAFVSPEDYRRLSGPEPTEIGAWIQPDRNTGELFYFFGPVVQSTDFIPDGLEPLEVESADYAVFPVPPGNGNLTLLNENVRRMWKYIFGEWLPQNKNYRTAEGKIDLEVYHSGRTSLYVPVSRL